MIEGCSHLVLADGKTCMCSGENWCRHHQCDAGWSSDHIVCSSHCMSMPHRSTIQSDCNCISSLPHHMLLMTCQDMWPKTCGRIVPHCTLSVMCHCYGPTQALHYTILGHAMHCIIPYWDMPMMCYQSCAIAMPLLCHTARCTLLPPHHMLSLNTMI